MNLTYKILWIEDKPDTIIAKRNIIKRHLIAEKGFEIEIDDIKTFEDFETKVGYDGLQKYDLLLVDLDLGNGVDTNEDGNAIITKIRHDKIYTEIIFYSSHYEELEKKIQANYIEGIFTTPRKDISLKAIAIIDITLHKIQDVNSLRGLIMAEVAELDRIKERIIKKFNTQADSAFKKYIKEDVFEKIKEDLENLNCIVNVENSDCSYDEINLEELQKNFFYDAYKKSRTIYKIKRQKCNDINFVHNDYYKCVVKKRNVFAHEEEQVRKDGTKYLNYTDGTPLEFTEEHCIQIRKDIKKYKIILKEIESKIDE